MPIRKTRKLRTARMAAVATLAIAMFPAAASAAVCPDQPKVTQAFALFGDTNDYFLARVGTSRER